MKGILIVDHGSVRAEANDMMECMANLLQTMAGPEVVVSFAHMDLAEPDIAAGFAACVQRGANDVIVFPYMLSPGRHSTTDIPRMVAAAAKPFPHVTFSVTPAFGVHEKLGERCRSMNRGGAPQPAIICQQCAECGVAKSRGLLQYRTEHGREVAW